jgi:hypothetical protein
MPQDKATLLRELATGNPVDLEKVIEVERQLGQLKDAGVARRTGYAVTQPLGHPSVPQRRQLLANASAQAKSA